MSGAKHPHPGSPCPESITPLPQRPSGERQQAVGWGENARKGGVLPHAPQAWPHHGAPGPPPASPALTPQPYPVRKRSLTKSLTKLTGCPRGPQNPLWSGDGVRSRLCATERGQCSAGRQHRRIEPRRRRRWHGHLPAAEKRALGYGGGAGPRLLLSPRKAPAVLSTSSLCCRPPAYLGQGGTQKAGRG